MKNKKLFSLLLTALCVLSVSGADIYVARAKGKNKNPGTKEAPVRNIWKAIEIAKPGDVIHITAGTYHGKMSSGWINLNKPVSLIGGYSKDFAQRDPLKFHTLLRPTNKQNATKPVFGTLTADFRKFGAASNVVIDGLIIDHTDANNYHAKNGKPEGFAEGMYMIPPAKGSKPMPSLDRYALHANSDGNLTIQNCLFLNSSNYAVNVQHFSGNVKILNNVFMNSRMVAAEVRSTNGKPFAVNYEFAYNTVLFTWTRTKEFEDMGYGVRTNEGITSNLHHNILGLNCMAGYDNTKGNSKKKKVTLENNVFFLNKKADVAITISPNIKFMKVEDDGFDDLADADGMESVENNIGFKDPSLFKGRIDDKFLAAFLSATYTEKVHYNENSPINQFRAALGLNKQGTITSKVTMYANPYPFDSALKFFGAVKDYGAQPVK
ncbi:MAG: right-handed parallel beta-helix repeat-containing protein [Lentisphaeria bacterium]|nr:right-handed parallel beta-helix repeat-containing protein [Lentisphaeria bacterium]